MSQVAGSLQAKLQQQQGELEAAADTVRLAQQQAVRADELSSKRKVSCAVWGCALCIATLRFLGRAGVFGTEKWLMGSAEKLLRYVQDKLTLKAS